MSRHRDERASGCKRTADREALDEVADDEGAEAALKEGAGGVTCTDGAWAGVVAQ